MSILEYRKFTVDLKNTNKNLIKNISFNLDKGESLSAGCSPLDAIVSRETDETGALFTFFSALYVFASFRTNVSFWFIKLISTIPISELISNILNTEGDSSIVLIFEYPQR